MHRRRRTYLTWAEHHARTRAIDTTARNVRRAWHLNGTYLSTGLALHLAATENA